MTVGLAQRAATFILTAIGRRKLGITVVLMPAIARNLGPIGAVRWMAVNMPKYERAMTEMGPLRAHLMCTMASLFNGCAYCIYGNARSFELYYFQQHDKLFPMDAQGLISLTSLEDAEVLREVEAALSEAGIGDEMAMIRRLYELKLQGAEPRADDRHLVHAIKMFDVLNFCAIESLAALDDAHDFIQADEALMARYAEARLRAGRTTPR